MTETTKRPSRFDYVQYDSVSQEQQAHFKRAFEALEQAVEQLLGAGRPQSLILTKLEEAYMWVGKAIRDRQIAGRVTTLQEGRTNS